jgi:hypothetical protein
MQGETARITLYDKDHAKYFETVIKLHDKKGLAEINEMLKNKGTHIRIEYEGKTKEVDWF